VEWFPDKAHLFIAAIEDADYMDEKIHWWDNVYGFNMRCVKDMAMKEPLVDNVEPNSICTQPYLLFSVDIRTVQKADLAFSRPFTLVALRNDNIHAFVAYFDIEFTQAHKPVFFSTSPKCKYTHWKQTVFYLNNVLPVLQGEQVTGTLACKPNQKNPRDLDIDITYNFHGKHQDVVATQSYWLR